MSKIDLVRKEMMNAMKAGDKPRKEALSLLLSALKNKQIDKRADLTEDEENAIIYVKFLLCLVSVLSDFLYLKPKCPYFPCNLVPSICIASLKFIVPRSSWAKMKSGRSSRRC